MKFNEEGTEFFKEKSNYPLSQGCGIRLNDLILLAHFMALTTYSKLEC